MSNLLANAISHGASSDAIIILHASTTDQYWEISIANKDGKIPEETLKNIFNPFQREGVEFNHNGLGLGLFISSEIAKVHQGILSVTSDEEYTCFTLRVII